MRSCGKVEIKHVVDTDTSGQKGDGLFHELLGLRAGSGKAFDLRIAFSGGVRCLRQNDLPG